MFIEKNGRNFVFGQPTIKGWSSVSPSRLIALTVSRTYCCEKMQKQTRSLIFLSESFFSCQFILVSSFKAFCLLDDFASSFSFHECLYLKRTNFMKMILHKKYKHMFCLCRIKIPGLENFAVKNAFLRLAEASCTILFEQPRIKRR